MPEQPIPGLWAGHSGLGDLCECRGCVLTRQQHAEPEPRIFHAGDPEPTDVAEVRHTSSQRFQACVTVDTVAGIEVSRSQCWTDGGGDPLDWADLTRRLGNCTLTEVVDPSMQSTRPPLTSTQFETAALGAGGRWSGLADQLDPDQGGLTGSSVIVEGARPAAPAGRSDTNGASPAPGDAGNDLGQLRAETITWFIGAIKAVGTSPFVNLVEVGAPWIYREIAEEFADALLAAGWQPPAGWQPSADSAIRIFRYANPSSVIPSLVKPVYRVYSDGRVTRQGHRDGVEVPAGADALAFLERQVDMGHMVEASE